MPMWASIEVLSTIETGLAENRQRRLDEEEGPFRLTAIERSKRASPHCSSGRKSPIPALTNRMSRPPKPSRTASATAFRAATSPASARIASTSPSSVRAASSVSRLLPVMATRAPSLRNWRAVSNPMPPVPPVIRARLLPSLFKAMSSGGDRLDCRCPARCQGDGTSSALKLDFRSWNSSSETPNDGRIDAWVKSTGNTHGDVDGKRRRRGESEKPSFSSLAVDRHGKSSKRVRPRPAEAKVWAEMLATIDRQKMTQNNQKLSVIMAEGVLRPRPYKLLVVQGDTAALQPVRRRLRAREDEDVADRLLFSCPVGLCRQRTRSSCASGEPESATISVWVKTSMLAMVSIRSMR